MILEKIDSPKDLKALSVDQLIELAAEIRMKIVKTVIANGGHLASSLGVVELTIALHYCYDFIHDRLIFDVGHQCYPHKLLTGRRKKFPTLRKYGGLSGFPYPPESSYDLFHTGHAGTSLSLGSGVACWDKHNGKDDRKMVVVIGDAALGAGVALEAINTAGHKDRDMLIVLNDNEMSISRTVGAMAKYLSRIRMAPIYRETKKELQSIISGLPIIGDKMDKGISEITRTLKNALVPGHIFEELGLGYYGPIDGHNLPLVIETVENLKEKKGVTLLHLLTSKGKGYEKALDDPESFHGISPASGEALAPGNVSDLDNTISLSRSGKKSYTDIFGETLIELADEMDDLVAITAAMPEGTGLKEFSRKHAERFHDVGITEQHAVAFASGLSFAGAKPVVAVYSTFLQRSFDQVFQEICLQNADVVLALDRGGVVGQDGPTHHGLYDISYLRPLPNMTIMAPRDGEEFRAMIRFAVEQKGPVAIRFPRSKVPGESIPSSTPLEKGRGEILKEGRDVVIIAYGSMVYPALAAAQRLTLDGIDTAVINARFVKPLDRALILEASQGKELVVTVEEHALAGGFGSAVMEFLGDSGDRGCFLRLGVGDRFVEQGSREELLQILGLTPEGITRRILEYVNEKVRPHSRRRQLPAARSQEIF